MDFSLYFIALTYELHNRVNASSSDINRTKISNTDTETFNIIRSVKTKNRSDHYIHPFTKTCIICGIITNI